MKISVEKWNATQRLVSQTIKAYETLPVGFRPPLDKVLVDTAAKVVNGTINQEEVLTLIAMLYWNYLLSDITAPLLSPSAAANTTKPAKRVTAKDLAGKVSLATE